MWLELPVLESVLTPGGTPTSLSQAASSRSLACTHSSLSRDLAHQHLNLVVAQIFIDSLGEPYTALQAYRLILVWLSLPDTETAGPGLGYNTMNTTIYHYEYHNTSFNTA